MRTILQIAAVLTSGLILFQTVRRVRSKKRGVGSWGSFAAIVILNFLVFWWVAALSGGDALNGKIVGDQYFLGEHGRYAQVSMGFWIYSLAHAWVTILSYVVLFGWLIIGGITGRIDLPNQGDELHPRGRGTV